MPWQGSVDVRRGKGGAQGDPGVLGDVSDQQAASVAGEQFNRISRDQLIEVGLNASAIDWRVGVGRLVLVDHCVYAMPPVLENDPWGRWMGATLTHPYNSLSHISSAVARELLSWEGPLTTVTRPGSGGTRRQGDLLIHRSESLEGDLTTLRGIPITTVERTLVDLAPTISDRAMARAVREAVRLEQTTLVQLGSALGRFRGRRGVRRLAATIARYAGLPLERVRSGSEVRALEVLRDAERPMPRLNVDVAGEEADLSWPNWRLIIEIDGDPFHKDKGADARKEDVWRRAGWEVRRLPSNDVHDRPHRLLERAVPPNVHATTL